MFHGFIFVEGLFEQYISDQDYKPKWTAIEPVSTGKYIMTGV